MLDIFLITLCLSVAVLNVMYLFNKSFAKKCDEKMLKIADKIF